jgi:hypothetical protein
MIIASYISEHAAIIAEVGGVSATVVLPAALWLRKHGRARVVAWFREALSHGASEGALLTVRENNAVALEIHSEIKDIGSRLYLSELAMNARLDLHDQQSDRLEDGLRQLTAVMLRDPRTPSVWSEANGTE